MHVVFAAVRTDELESLITLTILTVFLVIAVAVNILERRRSAPLDEISHCGTSTIRRNG